MSPFVRVLFACLTTVLLSCYLPPLPDNRPDPPVITGPSEGFVDSTYTFTLLGRDPDSNNIRLRVSWGDGDTSQWTPFIHSGETTQVTHSWTEPGTYTLRAQAMDWKDSVSEWSKGRVVSVYPLLPLRVVDSIPLPISPDYLVLSPDGERLYAVREGGDVCVLRTADGVPVGSLQLRDLSGIPVISPAGRCIYYASEEDYVYAVSAEDYTVIDSAYGQGNLTGVSLSPDGSTLYAVGWYDDYVSVIRTSDMTLVDSLPHGRDNISGVLATGDSRYLYVLCGPVRVVSIERREVVATIPACADFGKLLPDPEYLYLVDDRRGVFLIRTSNHTVVDTVFGGAWGLSVHPGGEYLYLTAHYLDEESSSVVVVKTADKTVTRLLKLLDPSQFLDIACHPDGNRVYVGAKGDWVAWLYVLGY